MTAREEAILWLSSFVKNKEPMTLIPKQLIRLMHEALTAQQEIVRCKDCKYAILTYGGECKYCKKRMDDDGGMDQLYLPGDWFCADGERKEGETG